MTLTLTLALAHVLVCFWERPPVALEVAVEVFPGWCSWLPQKKQCRVCERYQENTVQLLNRNNKQTIGVVNKQKTNSWVLNKQLAWSSHRGLQKPFLMSVWTKFGYLSAPVMTIIHKKTKKLPQKAKKRRFTFSKQRRKFLTTFPLRRLCAAPANFCPKPHHFTKNGQKNTVRTENKHSCL